MFNCVDLNVLPYKYTVSSIITGVVRPKKEDNSIFRFTFLYFPLLRRKLFNLLQSTPTISYRFVYRGNITTCIYEGTILVLMMGLPLQTLQETCPRLTDSDREAA